MKIVVWGSDTRWEWAIHSQGKRTEVSDQHVYSSRARAQSAAERHVRAVCREFHEHAAIRFHTTHRVDGQVERRWHGF